MTTFITDRETFMQSNKVTVDPHALRAEREGARLTLRQLSDRASIGVHTITRLESDQRGGSARKVTVMALARALGVTVGHLQGGETDGRPRIIRDRVRYLYGLKDVRLESGLSQTELAVLTGIDAGSISKYENLKRRVSEVIIVKLADALGVSPETLERKVESLSA